MAVWMVRILDPVNPEGQPVGKFEDVGSGLWWALYAERLADLGVTHGCSAEPARYCPYEPVTRAEMASFLARAFDLETAPPAGFDDTEGNPHQANINAIARTGITIGCSTDPFLYCPKDPVTRAEMATFLARALGLV